MHHETALADPIVSVDTLPLEVAVVVATLNEAANVERLGSAVRRR